MKIHKDGGPPSPHLSFILLDWSCREQFNTLDWLQKQDVPKDQYELIWVELYDRVVDEAMEKADVVITCNQKGTYNKHFGYNEGLLHAKGELICVCDSDAVFPPDFVSSVLKSFQLKEKQSAIPQVLMHYEWRTSLLYPDGLTETTTLKDMEQWKWWPLIVNEGACMTVRRSDAIRFGGFDEHESYRGYLCGPYDLGWRLVNAGWPEIWHDESVALWHFAHPDPIGTNGHKASLKQLLEKSYPHIHGHALTAVDAFSTGRFQPLKENSKIWALRMQDRKIGSELETRYCNLTGQNGYTRWNLINLWLELYLEIIAQYLKDRVWNPLRRGIRRIIGKRVARKLRALYMDKIAVYRVNHSVLAEFPILLFSYRGHNIIKYKLKFYAVQHGIEIDLSTEKGVEHEDLIASNEFYNLVKKIKNKK